MKRISVICFFILASTFVNAQDSTKKLNHEIGFNTVSLIKQIISNNPSGTLPQLPYDVFYNIYYKNLIGARIGVGISKSHLETEVMGAQNPRTTDETALNLRAGLSYNFVRSGKITLNVFGDFIMQKIGAETVVTTTVQQFPNPLQNLTVTSSDKIDGIGAQIGVGVKYNIYKHLSLYAEVPFVYLIRKSTSTVAINDAGDYDETTTTTKNTTSNIILPTTIYLVLRF